MVIKILKNNTAKQTLVALNALKKKSKLSKTKTLSNFYGKLEGAFGDGLSYQKRIRNEW